MRAIRSARSVDREAKTVANLCKQQRPVRLTPLLNELGIRARLSSLPPSCSGMIECAGERWTIKVNRREAPERQRYTLALEIAHFVLNRELLVEHGRVAHDVLYRSALPAQAEMDARKLALDILLPAAAVRDDWLATGASGEGQQLIDLAEIWRVTVNRMEARVMEFDHSGKDVEASGRDWRQKREAG